MSSAENNIYSRWTGIPDAELTPERVEQILKSVDDDVWVTAACVDRLVDDVPVQNALLQLGIQRTEGAVQRGKQVSASSASLLDREDITEDEDIPDTREWTWQVALETHFRNAPEDAQLCLMRIVLLKRLDRLNTFVEICEELSKNTSKEMVIDEEWEDDPWADSDAPASSSKNTPVSLSSEDFMSLSSFLTFDLLEIACTSAAGEHFGVLKILLTRHMPLLWPSQFTILDSIPPYSPPSEYRDFLPSSASTNFESKILGSRWRPESDWAESREVGEVLKACNSSLDPEILAQISDNDAHATSVSNDISNIVGWYRRRVNYIISSTGMIDIALATVQHGASQGVPDLDELGEDLSLLSRLVYDAPRTDTAAMDEDWTLDRWKSMSPADVVRAYLAHSTPASVAKDIARLVMPYLFVLESRVERAGQPDPDLPDRLLHEYILGVSLDIVAAVLEASKPTLPAAQRLIRSDEDIVRLALACLYGSDSKNEWSTMSRIFECLPAWDIPRDTEHEVDEADATVVSLGAFVTPSTSRPRCTPSDLLIFFKPLPLTSLSRALDILDVHLEAGEILARWNVPAPLRWFLQSFDNAAEQRAWATRMARRAGGPGDELHSREDWEWLLDDMLKLCSTSDTGLKSAFGHLSTDEVVRIFFGGLLSSGRFDIAKQLLHSSRSKLSFDSNTIEEICLSASREFYDNASSGNYKVGDMKLAYDCLDVPPLSDRLLREKEFIEATSRLSSFNIMSRPGIPISPIEIRLTKDRLSLISRVMSSNADAYKHTQVILDLLYKLGFKNDVAAEVKTLAMLADTALQAEDFIRAFEASERMISLVLKYRASALAGLDDPKVQEASEVCWVACFQLGRQHEFHDVQKKLLLLGRALELCPADKLFDVLTAWRRLESEDMSSREAKLAKQTLTRNGVAVPRSHYRSNNVPKPLSSLPARLQELHLPELRMPSSPLVNAEDAAALASRTFNRVTSNFPFSVGGRNRSGVSEDQSRSRSREGSRRRQDLEDVSAQASRVLQKGIGWLIGADDES